MPSVEKRIRDAKAIHDRIPPALQRMGEELTRIMASPHHTMEGKTKKCRELRDQVAAEVDALNRAVDGEFIAARDDVRAREVKQLPAAPEDTTALLLHEQQLSRHLGTLRARTEAHPDHASMHLRQALNEAKLREDRALLAAIEEILPELVGKAGLSRQAAVETTGLEECRKELLAILEAMKTPEQRQLERDQTLLIAAAGLFNQDREQIALDLASAGHPGANRMTVFGRAANSGEEITFRPVGEKAEVPVRNPRGWHGLFRMDSEKSPAAVVRGWDDVWKLAEGGQ